MLGTAPADAVLEGSICGLFFDVAAASIELKDNDNYFMPGQGSGGNVLAALCSFFVPGLGQLLQGRLGMAALQFVLAIVLWFVLLGWAIHLWSIIDAARFHPGK